MADYVRRVQRELDATCKRWVIVEPKARLARGKDTIQSGVLCLNRVNLRFTLALDVLSNVFRKYE